MISTKYTNAKPRKKRSHTRCDDVNERNFFAFTEYFPIRNMHVSARFSFLFPNLYLLYPKMCMSYISAYDYLNFDVDIKCG